MVFHLPKWLGELGSLFAQVLLAPRLHVYASSGMCVVDDHIQREAAESSRGNPERAMGGSNHGGDVTYCPII